jgi:hypothetical protein
VAIDYSSLAFPKTRPRALDKADKAKAVAAKDKAENAKARRRAKGQCEVQIPRGLFSLQWIRCPNKDTQTHHLKGGIGRRNRGDSILASQKLRVCQQCHDDIGAKILKPTTATHDARSVRFWRAR